MKKSKPKHFAMPLDSDSVSSDDSFDPGRAAIEAQQRIFRLRRERDVRVSKIIAESNAALASIQSRVEKQREHLRLRRYETHNQQVSAIMMLVDERRRIELRMMNVVSRMRAVVEQVENKMLAGYDRREASVKASRFSGTKHRRYA